MKLFVENVLIDTDVTAPDGQIGHTSGHNLKVWFGGGYIVVETVYGAEKFDTLEAVVRRFGEWITIPLFDIAKTFMDRQNEQMSSMWSGLVGPTAGPSETLN